MSAFVVLHHTAWPGHADHYDLMLQVADGKPDARALVTFATEMDLFPTGTPPVPVQRLPDHRLAYLNYEGPVSGNRGNVARIESGTVIWPSLIEWDGEVSFDLASSRLSGRFVLRPLGKGRYLLKL